MLALQKSGRNGTGHPFYNAASAVSITWWQVDVPGAIGIQASYPGRPRAIPNWIWPPKLKVHVPDCTLVLQREQSRAGVCDFRRPVSMPMKLIVYRGSELIGDFALDRPLQIGRQKNEQEPLRTPYQDPNSGQWRLAIVPVREASVSRAHVRMDPLDGVQVRIANISGNNIVTVDDGTLLACNDARSVRIPCVLVLGEYRLVVEGDIPDSEIDSDIQSLDGGTPIPGGMSALSTLGVGAIPFGQLTPAAVKNLVGLLQAVTGLLQSAVSSEDFFQMAAKGVVGVVGLDAGAVLLRERNEWRPVAVHGNRTADENWRPSRRVLQSVLDHARTFWQVPGSASAELDYTASLANTPFVIASPICNRAGAVIGVLYGDSRSPLGLTGGNDWTKIVAMLVETFAYGVAVGLSRLEQEQAAVKAQVQFEQFFTPELSSQLALDSNLLEGRDAEVSLLFCDVRGFSRVSERLGPARTVEWLRDVMTELSECVIESHGVLVDYIGDELIAMWGAPVAQPDHAERACLAAIAMLRKLPALNARWRDTLQEDCRFGIGINTGVARVGNTGTNRKFKYGPLGNTVNLASRVQGATKYLKTDLLITAATHKKIPASFPSRRLCKVVVNNIREPVELYELAVPETTDRKLLEDYEAALNEFEVRKFRLAAKLLSDLVEEHPHDGPALNLLCRAVECLVKEDPHISTDWVLPGK